jgi:predicted DNA-binding transcriptional regulator AlpA
MEDESPFWTLADLAKRYRCSKRTVYRWMELKENPLPQPKINQKGVSCLWDKSTVISWENSTSPVTA